MRRRVSAWLSAFLGVTCHLVRIGEKFRRPVLDRPAFAAAQEDADRAARDAFLYQSMLEARRGGGRVDVICGKSGAGGESLLLTYGQTGRRSRAWWNTVLDQFSAADVLVPIARLEYSWPGGPVEGHFTARFGPDNRYLDEFSMRATSVEQLPEMLNRAVARFDEIFGRALAQGVLRPDPTLSLDTVEISPEIREYERSMATALNAYVMPAVATYVRKVEQRLAEGGVAAPLLLMKSSGGVIRGEGAAKQPVQTALSGPAAGVVGARALGLRAGHGAQPLLQRTEAGPQPLLQQSNLHPTDEDHEEVDETRNLDDSIDQGAAAGDDMSAPPSAPHSSTAGDSPSPATMPHDTTSAHSASSSSSSPDSSTPAP